MTQAQEIVNIDLARQISPRLYNRWLSIGQFPKIIQFKHSSKATQGELDLTYLLHAYTILLDRVDLWKYLPGFNKIQLYVTEDAVFIFQPWIQVLRLKKYSSAGYDDVERRQIVDAYLEMFEDLHRAGLCFYDVMLGLEHREGNIYLTKARSHQNQVRYQCVWIDVESIMRPRIDAEKTRKLKPAPYSPLNHLMYDADPSEGFSYLEQYIRLTTRMRYEEVAQRNLQGSSVAEPDIKEHGWSADIYLCLCELLGQQYLKVDQEFKYIVDELMQLPIDSLESPLPGPLTYRLSEPESTVLKEQKVEESPVVADNEPPSSTGILKGLKWVVLLIILVGLIWVVWTKLIPIRRTTLNVFETVEPLYTKSNAEFESGLKSVKPLLKSSLKPPSKPKS